MQCFAFSRECKVSLGYAKDLWGNCHLMLFLHHVILGALYSWILLDHIKWIVKKKIKKVTNLHVVPNLYGFLSFAGDKWRCSEECLNCVCTSGVFTLYGQFTFFLSYSKYLLSVSKKEQKSYRNRAGLTILINIF